MKCPTCGSPSSVYQFLDEWPDLPEATRQAIATAFAVAALLRGGGVAKSAEIAVAPPVTQEELVRISLSHSRAIELYEILRSLDRGKGYHPFAAAKAGVVSVLADDVMGAIDRYERGCAKDP